VIARRTEREEPLAFRLLYLCFRILFRVLTGRSVRSGNYAAYRGAYVQSMLFHPSFDLCYSSSLITLNADPVFVPCPRGTRYAGQSRMGLEKLLTHGVRMLMETGVEAFEGSGAVERVRLSDGATLDCDFVVVGVGVGPRTELAAQAGLTIDNGIRANQFLETSVPGVFAVGDVRSGSIKRCATAVGEGAMVVRFVHERFSAEVVEAPTGRRD